MACFVPHSTILKQILILGGCLIALDGCRVVLLRYAAVILVADTSGVGTLEGQYDLYQLRVPRFRSIP